MSVAASLSPAEEIRGFFPSRSVPRVLPYPFYAMLEPQLPPDGFLLLEELLQRLRERWRRHNLRAHDSRGLEPAMPRGCLLPLPRRALPAARPRSRNAGWPRARQGSRCHPVGCCTEVARGEILPISSAGRQQRTTSCQCSDHSEG